MKVIYHCYGGTHSSVLAAAVHTGLLSPEELPSPDRLLSLPLFDRRDAKDYGRIAAYGRDRHDNEVYVLGRRGFVHAPEAVFHALQSAFSPATPYVLVDTTPTLNWQMKVGGYLSRALGLKGIGRLLVTRGSRAAYPRVVALVDATMREVLSG